jgi:(2S)-methylsuccinyl-CoA dehydrogenase
VTGENAAALQREQHAVHGLAWMATYRFAIEQLADYTRRLMPLGRFGELERLLVTLGAGEYLAQVFGGIPMSQGETLRMESLGLSDAQIEAARSPRYGP